MQVPSLLLLQGGVYHYANECQDLLYCLRNIDNHVKGVRLLIKSLYINHRTETLCQVGDLKLR